MVIACRANFSTRLSLDFVGEKNGYGFSRILRGNGPSARRRFSLEFWAVGLSINDATNFLIYVLFVFFPPPSGWGLRSTARLGVSRASHAVWHVFRQRKIVQVHCRLCNITEGPADGVTVFHFESRDVPAECRRMVPTVSRLVGVSGVEAAGPVRQRSVCHGDCPAFCSANVRNRERSDPVRLCIRKLKGVGTDRAFSTIVRGARPRNREDRVLVNRPPDRRVERRRRRNPDCKGCPY